MAADDTSAGDSKHVNHFCAPTISQSVSQSRNSEPDDANANLSRLTYSWTSSLKDVTVPAVSLQEVFITGARDPV